MKILVAVVVSVFLSGHLLAQTSEERFICHSGNGNISAALVCSGSAQCDDCSDEMNCPGVHDLTSCNNPSYETCYDSNMTCNGVDECGNCADERNCFPPTRFHCKDGTGCTGIENVCDKKTQCHDGSDETTQGFGFRCPSYENKATEHRCIIPQELLQPSLPSMCADMEGGCYGDSTDTLNASRCWLCLDGTIIHVEQVRDNVFDCPDLSDECLSITENKYWAFSACASLLSNNKCDNDEVSCMMQKKEDCLPLSRICDGEVDCDDKIDENFCSRLTNCSDEPESEPFSCVTGRNGNSGVVAGKCDGILECLRGEDECGDFCENKPEYCEFIDPIDPNLTFGDKSNCTKRLSLSQLCDKTKDCEDGVDETYCGYWKQCDANNPSAGRFDSTCNSQRCNFERDCVNLADEMNCSLQTHFYCDNNQTVVPVWRVSDGIFDCEDFSDECNISVNSVSSRSQLISHLVLEVSLWIFMLLAIVGNSIVIANTSRELLSMLRRRLNCTSQRVGVCNKSMILNLAMSDFLMGIYLLIIAIKALEFNGNYCEEQREWLLSGECTFAGVVAMVSGQTSVLLMVLMTTYRLYGVINPFKAEKLRFKVINSIIIFIWVVSLLLAVIPILPSLKDTFNTEISGSQPYVQSLNLKNLRQMVETANKLPGLNETFSTEVKLSQKSFCQLFEHLDTKLSYCQDNPTNLFESTGYYGSEGVCLPRFYGNAEEPASVYTLCVVIFNFVAFLYMFIAYIVIYRLTSWKHYGHEHTGSVCEAMSKENQAMWGKIFRLILTDFLCWIPISVLSFLSYAGVYIPPSAYPATAIYLIPINSAANPWIYSSFLLEYVRKIWGSDRGLKWFFMHSLKIKERDTVRGSRRTGDQTTQSSCCGLIRRSKDNLDVPMTPNSPSSFTNNTNDNLTMATEL